MTSLDNSDAVVPPWLPRQPATARALLTDQRGRWLLVRDRRRPHRYLPGGLIELEEPPDEACAREVEEETGLRIAVGDLLVITWQPARKPLRTARWSLIFDGGVHDSSALTARPAPNDPDVVGCEWLTPEEALALLTPAIADRLRRWRARPAGSGTLFFVQQLFD